VRGPESYWIVLDQARRRKMRGEFMPAPRFAAIERMSPRNTIAARMWCLDRWQQWDMSFLALLARMFVVMRLWPSNVLGMVVNITRVVPAKAGTHKPRILKGRWSQRQAQQ